MIWWIFWGLLALPSILTMSNDPSPGLFTSIEESRRLTCERASVELTRQKHPGLLEDAEPRGDFMDRAAVLCSESVLSYQRSPRDNAVLADLAATTTNVARRIAVAPELKNKTWLVEVHYPNVSAVSTIAFAMKSTLVESGLTVTDRLPILAVGDIQVLAQIPPLQAYPLACQRYFGSRSTRRTVEKKEDKTIQEPVPRGGRSARSARTSLRSPALATSPDAMSQLIRGELEVQKPEPRLAASDAVLSLLVLDSRETALHAGTCVNGRWTWLQ